MVFSFCKSDNKLFFSEVKFSRSLFICSLSWFNKEFFFSKSTMFNFNLLHSSSIKFFSLFIFSILIFNSLFKSSVILRYLSFSIIKEISWSLLMLANFKFSPVKFKFCIAILARFSFSFVLDNCSLYLFNKSL